MFSPIRLSPGQEIVVAMLDYPIAAFDATLAQAIDKAIADAVAAEREECAEIAESCRAYKKPPVLGMEIDEFIAYLIRARGEDGRVYSETAPVLDHLPRKWEETE